jgi:hypothetical protein
MLTALPINPAINGILKPTLSISRPARIFAGVLVIEYKPMISPIIPGLAPSPEA